MVNRDPAVAGRLKVVFLPNFNVKNAQLIYPAADLSEQISTAGKEASGTGNMKFMMNGALTIGTLDGANVEIREEVGEENFFLFGLTAAEVERVKREGYRPARVRRAQPGAARGARPDRQRGSSRAATARCSARSSTTCSTSDPFLVLADFADYVECQARVDAAWQRPDRWTRMSIANTARSGQVLVGPRDPRVRERHLEPPRRGNPFRLAAPSRLSGALTTPNRNDWFGSVASAIHSTIANSNTSVLVS